MPQGDKTFEDSELVQLRSMMNNIVSQLLIRVTIIRSLVQTMEVEPRRVPQNIKNQLYVLIMSSQVILLEFVGSLEGGLLKVLVTVAGMCDSQLEPIVSSLGRSSS